MTFESFNERAICVELLDELLHHILVGPNALTIDIFTLQVNSVMLESLQPFATTVLKQRPAIFVPSLLVRAQQVR